MQETSVTLLGRLSENPSEADWQTLRHIYSPFIQRLVSQRFGLDEATADDVTQDVMIVLLRVMPRFDRQRPGSFRRFLRVLTERRVLRVLRRQSRPGARGIGGDHSAVMDDFVDRRDDFHASWEREHWQHVFDQLRHLVWNTLEPQTREAFHLLVDQRLTPIDAANRLGVQVAVVYAAKCRVLRKMRELGEGLIDFE